MSVQQAYLYNVEKNSVILQVKVNKTLKLALQAFDNINIHERNSVWLMHIVILKTFIPPWLKVRAKCYLKD